jgi:hypothetical protein
MNCPCIDCICLAACIRQNSVKTIIDKCHTIAKYIAHDPTSYDNALTAVKLLKPLWYHQPWRGSRSFVRQCITNLVHHSMVIEKLVDIPIEDNHILIKKVIFK